MPNAKRNPAREHAAIEALQALDGIHAQLDKLQPGLVLIGQQTAQLPERHQAEVFHRVRSAVRDPARLNNGHMPWLGRGQPS